MASLLLLGTVALGDSTAPLADAIKQGDLETAEILLSGKVDVNAPQPDGMTALHWAVFHDEAQLVKALIDRKADAQAKNRYGVAPLSIAAQNGSEAVVKLLLDAGAHADTELPGGETALMTAARTGKVGAVSALISHGADVNAKERRNQTAIMWAAAEGNADVVATLIDAGADYKIPLPSGFTPFFFAIRQGHADVVKLFLAKGIDINDTMNVERAARNGPANGTTALHLAVENGHFELALELLNAGADPNASKVGYTALHAMTWVRKPIRGDGDPPPIGSGKISSLELVRQLVAHGADVNARHGKHQSGSDRLSKTHATPLLLAAETGDLPLIQLLVELGANPLLPNADDCTPLLAASGVGVLSDGDESAGTEEDAIATILFLIKQGADINAVDKSGKTAMHGAAFKSWSKLVQVLAENGADINVWNTNCSRGWTPLMIAQGHRPGNFRPSLETVTAIEKVIREAETTAEQ
ncbi:MAG: ankyrin repeat domain-containing protein [Planctomycetaceae bacterium]|nr:ankyrin repeat domain-containing protein [Planctomycetaceae bacterium]MCB9952785.1 ankyrin repeat domain-containing protein [Planctomycetaceae bacterium]